MLGLSDGTIVGILSGVGASFAGAVAYVWKGKDAQILRLESEVAAGRLKIEELQNKAIESLKQQLEDQRKRAETDDRLARSMLEQTALLKAVVNKA